MSFTIREQRDGGKAVYDGPHYIGVVMETATDEAPAWVCAPSWR